MGLLQSSEYFVRETIDLCSSSAEQCNILNELPKLGKNLRSVEFNTKISAAQGQWIALHCHNLTHVRFRKQNCSMAIKEILLAYSNIEHLNVHFYLLPVGPCTEKLSFDEVSLPKLRALAIMGDSFKHEHIGALQMSKNIRRLHIYGPKINESTLHQIPLLCPELISLGLTHAPLNDDILAQLTLSCRQILHLDISGAANNQGITDAGILAVVQNLKGLQSLNIMDNNNLTDATLVHIYTYCANTLKTLHLNCWIGDGEGHLYGADAVDRLLTRCTFLHTLSFEYWHQEDGFHPHIRLPASTLSNLTTLALRGKVACSDNLVAISRHGVQLQVLGFDGPRQLYSPATSTHLLGSCPNLIALYGIDMDIELLSLWRESRPGVTVGVAFPAYLDRFDVLNV